MPSAPVLGEAGFVVPNMPPMTFPAEMSNCGQPANFCHSGSDEQTTSYTLPDGCIASVNHAHALAQNAGSEQVFRCLLKSKMCGAVIGKGGSNVQSLRQNCGVRVKINNYHVSSEEREVVVAGTCDNVSQGLCQMFNFLSPSETDITCKVLCTTPQINAVSDAIGDLRDNNACTIKVCCEDEEQSASYSPDRIVLLIGGIKAVAGACMAVSKIIKEHPPAHLSAGTKLPPVPLAKGGDRSGANSMDRGPIIGSKRPHHGSFGGNDQGPMKMARFSHPRDGDVENSTGGHKRRNLDVSNEMPDHAETTVRLSNIQAAMIIGRGGGTINQIRNMCSAKVAVDESKVDMSRKMTISGPLDQVEAAINLVRQVFSKDSYDAGNPKHQNQSNSAMPMAPLVNVSGQGQPNGMLMNPNQPACPSNSQQPAPPLNPMPMIPPPSQMQQANQQMQQMSGMMMPDGSMCMMNPMNMMGQDGNMMCGPDGQPMMMGDMSGQGMSCGSGDFQQMSSTGGAPQMMPDGNFQVSNRGMQQNDVNGCLMPPNQPHPNGDGNGVDWNRVSYPAPN